MGWVGNLVKTSVMYFKGSKPFILALLIKLITAAELVPDCSEPKNKKFLRPSAMGLIVFSTWLLSMGAWPFSKNAFNSVSLPKR